jgi:hypothetical protein
MTARMSRGSPLGAGPAPRGPWPGGPRGRAGRRPAPSGREGGSWAAPPGPSAQASFEAQSRTVMASGGRGGPGSAEGHLLPPSFRLPLGAERPGELLGAARLRVMPHRQLGHPPPPLLAARRPCPCLEWPAGPSPPPPSPSRPPQGPLGPPPGQALGKPPPGEGLHVPYEPEKPPKPPHASSSTSSSSVGSHQ